MEQKLYPSAPSLEMSSTEIESMINKQLAKQANFNNSIQNIMMMMKYYELEEKKYRKKYNKYKLINNLINSTDGLLIISTSAASITLSITGVGIIVVPIAAGAGCVTGILVKIYSSWLKKKEQNYIKKYACIQKTLDEFRHLYTTSLKDNHINEEEYRRFVNMYENYLTNQNTNTQSAYGNTNTQSAYGNTTKAPPVQSAYSKPNSFL